MAIAGTQAMGATLLFDFEGDDAPEVKARTFHVGATNAYATSGTRGLRFCCDPWRQGMAEWPSFTLKPPISDWSGFDRLVIDVVSLGGTKEEWLYLYVAGGNGPIQSGLGAKTLLPARGYVQWIVPLKGKWPKSTPPDAIKRFHVYTDHPQSVDVVLDRVTLLAAGEKPPVADGPCVGRDILPLAIACNAECAVTNRTLKAEVARLRGYMQFCAKAAKSDFPCRTMALGLATSMENVRPRSAIKAGAIPKGGISVRLARRESEGVQLLVAPLGEGLRNVRVKVGDLADKTGTVFSSKNIDCDVVGYVNLHRRPPNPVGYNVPTKGPPGYSRKTTDPDTGWWPDPILDYLDGVDIESETVQDFWVRVNCPETQKAGTYRGMLTVSVEGGEKALVPLSVRVNDFEVPAASPLPVIVTFEPMPAPHWKERKALLNDPLAPVNIWKRHRLEWGDFLSRYYITMDSLYHTGQPDFEILERLRSRGRLGLFNLGYWKYPATTNDAHFGKWREKTLPRLKKAYDEAKRRGMIDHAYCYGCDEVTKECFDAMRLAACELKKTIPGVPISTTARDKSYGMTPPLDVLDWFTPLVSQYFAEPAKRSREAGHQVWWYICCGPPAPYPNMFVECPPIEGRVLMGAQTVRMRPDGFLYYQISIWNSPRCIEGGPFTDWLAQSWMTWHGDGQWTCVGPDGKPLPTIRLENFRDGLEDYAYAKLLEQKLREVESSKLKVESDGGVWVSRAKELLAVPREVMDTLKNFTDDPAVLYRWRDAMADLIEDAK